MRVSDLIAQLQKLPQHLQVFVPVNEENSAAEFEAPTKVTVDAYKPAYYNTVRIVNPAAESTTGTAVFLR